MAKQVKKAEKAEKIEKKVDTYSVMVDVPSLNIRKGAGMNHDVVGVISDRGTYVIVEKKDGKGSAKGWGKLENGKGWIALDFCKEALL